MPRECEGFPISNGMDTLAKLFGSEAKVKLMRLFLFNSDKAFSISDASLRVKAGTEVVRKEIINLEKIGLIKRRSYYKEGSRKQGFVLNHLFPYLLSLEKFLINLEPEPKDVIRKITKLGTIKLIIISGIFIHEAESRADLLIVGDGVKKAKLENTIKTIESEIGRELRYAYFTTEDFKYRLSMFDKLTRDILDYPHRKVLNRIGLE